MSINQAAGLDLTFFTASKASYFRSTWGSSDNAPAYDTQVCPTPTPHVGHGTEDHCSGVSALALITQTYCDKTQPRSCSLLNACCVFRSCFLCIRPARTAVMCAWAGELMFFVCGTTQYDVVFEPRKFKVGGPPRPNGSQNPHPCENQRRKDGPPVGARVEPVMDR